MTIKEILLLIIIFIIACVRFFYFIPDKPNFDKIVGKDIVLSGEVIDYPDERSFNTRIILKLNEEKSNILVIIPKEYEVSYGDEIKVEGVLETPENFITSSGKEFNYNQYLANKNIYFIVKGKSIEIISRGNGNIILENLFKLRRKFISNIDRVISVPNNFLANGLILGERGGFDNEMKDQFVRTGTIHIVALSGYNITIVTESVVKMLSLVLSGTLSIIFGIFVILLFVLMTGASSTAVRAGIMATIVLFSRLTGREYQAGRALIIAALFMIAYDVRAITDISFQLSFLATAGVLFIHKKIINYLTFIPSFLRDLVSTTISATIAVLPILLHSTGVLSIVSLPANILILPVIPLAMLFSFLVGLIGFISPSFSFLISFISELLLSYILKVVNFFSSLSFASVEIKSFPWVLVVIIYSFLIFWVFKKLPPKRW